MRQIFCKLPNPFPYLNYITKFFFGRKSYRQRVFQGPLTLGLQSPSLRASSFRLACGNPSIPTHNHITALNRAPVVLHPSVRVGYNRRSLFAGALAGFPARVPARSFITAQTAHLLFCIFLSASVTTDGRSSRVRSQVFPARVPSRSHITALNRAPVVLFLSVRVGYTDLCYLLTPAVKIRYTFPMKRIYIGNLSFNTTEESLNNAFSAFGEVISATLIMDKITNRSKGFGFVEMPDDDAAFNAIRSLNGKDLDGRKVRVSIAEDKSPRNPRSNR